MGESLSADFLVVGLEALDRSDRHLRAGLIAGVMLGLAVIARYGSAVFVAVAMIWVAVSCVRERARWKTLVGAAAAGLGTALVLGAVDKATWGDWFHSFRTYTDFNVLSNGAAARFGAEPWPFYLHTVALLAPIWAWPGVAYAIARQRPRAALPLVCAAAYLLVITLTPHKEPRFLYPGLAVFALGAAPGLVGLVHRFRPDLRAALAALALVLSVGPVFIDNELSVQRPDQFRAELKAGRGATGLLMVNEGLWGAGGFFWLGKNIPWMTCDFAQEPAFQYAMRDARFNRVVTYDDRALPELQAAGFKLEERIGHAAWLSR